jgi:two-component system response regulator MprA
VQILVVDDEHAVRESVRRALLLDGYEVHAVGGGAAALEWLAVESADAVVLDIRMPAPDGLEVCRRLRRADVETPVLMLTVNDRVEDVVSGLDAGADDYLTKPFDIRELRARLRALVRRGGNDPHELLGLADLRMDLATRVVRRGARPITLSRTEFALLRLLLQHQRRVLTRHQILEEVWGYDPGPRSNSLEVYVGYLRRKLEADGEPRLLHTVRGVGYVLREVAEP